MALNLPHRRCLVAVLAIALPTVLACNKKEGAAPAPSASVSAQASASSAPVASVAPIETGPIKPPSNAALLEPQKATEKAPDVYKVKFVTTKGEIVIEVHRDWAPKGADRFYNLVKLGFFDDTRFFRVLAASVVQFGLSGNPFVTNAWRPARLKDDKPKESNKRGYVTFAASGPDSRSTQVMIHLDDANTRYDKMGFVPFGKIISGIEAADKLYSGYGECAPQGAGPSQPKIEEEGNRYLDQTFKELDRLTEARIME